MEKVPYENLRKMGSRPTSPAPSPSSTWPPSDIYHGPDTAATSIASPKTAAPTDVARDDTTQMMEYREEADRAILHQYIEHGDDITKMMEDRAEAYMAILHQDIECCRDCLRSLDNGVTTDEDETTNDDGTDEDDGTVDDDAPSGDIALGNDALGNGEALSNNDATTDNEDNYPWDEISIDDINGINNSGYECQQWLRQHIGSIGDRRVGDHPPTIQ